MLSEGPTNGVNSSVSAGKQKFINFNKTNIACICIIIMVIIAIKNP